MRQGRKAVSLSSRKLEFQAFPGRDCLVAEGNWRKPKFQNRKEFPTRLRLRLDLVSQAFSGKLPVVQSRSEAKVVTTEEVGFARCLFGDSSPINSPLFPSLPIKLKAFRSLQTDACVKPVVFLPRNRLCSALQFSELQDLSFRTAQPSPIKGTPAVMRVRKARSLVG